MFWKSKRSCSVAPLKSSGNTVNMTWTKPKFKIRLLALAPEVRSCCLDSSPLRLVTPKEFFAMFHHRGITLLKQFLESMSDIWKEFCSEEGKASVIQLRRVFFPPPILFPLPRTLNIYWHSLGLLQNKIEFVEIYGLSYSRYLKALYGAVT